MKWLALFLLLATATNQPLLLRWVDKQGVIHITDDMTQIPEPYYSIYLKKIEELKARGEVKEDQNGKIILARPAAAAPTPKLYDNNPAPAISPYPEKSKEYWQNILHTNRQKLIALTDEFAKIEEELAALRNMGELAFLLQNKQKIREFEEMRAAKLQEIENTKKFLEKDLPEQARKAGVPPGWVR